MIMLGGTNTQANNNNAGDSVPPPGFDQDIPF